MTHIPDVVIVGAGLAGSSLAWHLAGQCRVRVVEQSAQEGRGATAQNAGMIRRLVSSSDERRLVCRSWELLNDLPSDDWAGEMPFRRTGSLVATTSGGGPAATSLQANAVALANRGVRVEQIDGAAIAEVAPVMAGSPVDSAIWIPDDGVCDAQALCRGFVRGARRRGAEFTFGIRVDGMLRDGDHVVGLRTNRGAIQAHQVVVASAAWTPRLFAELGMQRRVRPLARHVFVTEHHPLSRPNGPWCWIDDHDIYIRPYEHGFLSSPCDEFEVAAPLGPDSIRDAEAPARLETLRRLERFFPALMPVQIARGWVGLRTFSSNRHPIVGPDPDLPGLFWLTGLGGGGVGSSFALGERAARAMLSQTSGPAFA